MLRKEGQLKDCDIPLKAAHGDNELQALMRLLCQNDGPALMLNKLEGCNTPARYSGDLQSVRHA